MMTCCLEIYSLDGVLRSICMTTPLMELVGCICGCTHNDRGVTLLSW